MTMKHWQRGALMAVVIIIADQISKTLILAQLGHRTIEIFPFLDLVLVWNRGISFGLFHQDSMTGPYILAALSLTIAIFFAIWLLKIQSRGLSLAVGMIIGGALGNVIDRLRFGAVVDFLDFHAFNWHYPAFNVADSSIVLGIAFVVLDGLWFEPKRQKTAKP